MNASSPLFVNRSVLHCFTCRSGALGYLPRGLEGERATEVLPALRAIKLRCSELGKSESLRSLKPFIVAREESEHPVAVVVEIRALDTQ